MRYQGLPCLQTSAPLLRYNHSVFGLLGSWGHERASSGWFVISRTSTLGMLFTLHQLRYSGRWRPLLAKGFRSGVDGGSKSKRGASKDCSRGPSRLLLLGG